MYKLLIVDDEVWESQVLRYFVENSSLEISEVLECGNGTEAVKIALTEQPDICILDIKMPGLNGLEAGEQIKAVAPRCKLVFSTAYNYYEYAVRALRMGALDYLLKPVKKETFLRVVNKCIDALNEEENKKQHQTRHERMSYILESSAVKGLVTGQIDAETLWVLEDCNINENAVCTNYFWLIEPPLDISAIKALATQLRHEISSAGIKHMLSVQKKSIDLLVFGKFPEEEKHLEHMVEKIFDRVLAQSGISAQKAKGSWCNSIYELEHSAYEARKMLNVNVPVSSPPILENQSNASLPECQTEISQTLKNVPSEIRTMCTYMEENYKQKISLEDVTSYVGFSKYYGCRLYKMHMGMTIMDYLTHLRINKAKELLNEGEYSIKQICALVGYQDPNYFSWVFKKETGVTPTNFRYD